MSRNTGIGRSAARSPSVTSSTTQTTADDHDTSVAYQDKLETCGPDPEAQRKQNGESLRQTPSKSRGLYATLSRTLSRTSDTLEPGPAPDGGTKAWMTALVAHLVVFNTWGFINSFGLFQTYYVNTMKIGGESQVAWIGSLEVFILFFMGTFSGRALDAGYFRPTFMLGSVITLFGMFMLSLCKTYWQIFLAQGICIGLGFGCLFVPSLALVSTYFSSRRSMALAITVSGGATGGLVYPAIAERLLPQVGFPWTIRVMAFVQMAVAIVCATFLKVRTQVPLLCPAH